MSDLLLALSAGGGSLPAALHLPRSRLSAGGDGGAGSGGPQGRLPGASHFTVAHFPLPWKFKEPCERTAACLPAGVDPLAGGREGASGDDGGGRLRRGVVCHSAGADPGPEDRHPDRAERYKCLRVCKLSLLEGAVCKIFKEAALLLR